MRWWLSVGLYLCMWWQLGVLLWALGWGLGPRVGVLGGGLLDVSWPVLWLPAPKWGLVVVLWSL